MVRRHHGFCVVLDHHHRVAQVAQAQQGLEQAAIIPLMEPDRRLVEDIEDTDEAGTDLRGEPDALAFSTGQCGSRPIQRQVVQTDVDEKPEPFANFFQDAMSYHQFALGECQRTEEVGSRSYGEICHLRDRLFGYLDGQTFRPQSRPLADPAGFQQREVFIVWTAGYHGVADAIAGRAGSVRAIERKHAGSNFRITDAAANAGELLAIE
ncbi:MAG: hypothetical protein EWM73_03520 [Nitrospira sp.]|nr:MAG: hypothetical protein EWM73_03520 [Nitrospira sp.]